MKYIKVVDLKIIFERVIDKLKFEGIDQIEIENDLYRYIPTDEWDSFERDEIEVGSLYDDLDSLELLVNDIDRPCTYVDFDRVASVLRAISRKNNPV